MTIDLAALGVLPSLALAFMLVFGRIGSILMLMPGIGESSVPVRIRLGIALAITFVLYPLVSGRYPAVPQNMASLFVLFGHEILVGLAIGLALRLVLATLAVAGMIIANQIGIASALVFDPTMGGQGAILGGLMTMLGVTLILVTDLHHLSIAGLAQSYTLFPPGQGFPAGDFLMMNVRTIAESFSMALQISAPFIVYGLVFQFGLGVLARLMPQIQVYFMMTPASIAIGLIFFMLLTAAMMTWWLSSVEAVYNRFLGG